LALALHRDATSAVDEFVTRFRPADYNAAWLLVGDRTSLYALDMTVGDDGPDGGDATPVVEQLGPGIHTLENNPLHAGSPKQAHVRTLLGDAGELRGDAIVARLRSVLVDHSLPETETSTTTSIDDPGPHQRARPTETLAACVHTDSYGTRSSTLVSVPAAPGRAPRVLVADGHPCTSPFVDVTHLFEPRPRKRKATPAP